MGPYIISFLAAAVIGSRASASSGGRKIVLTLLACLPLALLAGLRSWSIGIDTSGYPLVSFYVSQNGGPFDVSEVTGCEIGFSFLIWFLSVLTRDFNAVLFFMQAVMLALLAIQLVKLDSRHVGAALFVYACIFFPWSLNLMRQALAGSLLLLAFQFARARRLFPFLLTMLFAVSIHRAVVFGFVVWPIYEMAVSENRRVRGTLLAIAFFFLTAVVVFIAFGGSVFDFLATIKSSYSAKVLGDGRFNVLFTLYPFLLAALGLFDGLGGRQDSEKRRVSKALSALMAFTGCASLISLLSQTLFRIAYTFLIFAPLQVSNLLDSVSSPSIRRAVCAVVLVASAFVFVWAYCYGDAAGSYPYHSVILGI